MMNLAKKIIRLTGSSSHIVNKTLPVDDPKVRRPDITKAQKYLLWTPKILLDDGLVHTIEYFKEALRKK
jgi:nucleoside-diphosphate-sugar epimerase